MTELIYKPSIIIPRGRKLNPSRCSMLSVNQLIGFGGFTSSVAVVETLNITLSSDNADGVINKRQWFSQALFSISGTSVRFTFEGPASGTFKWDACTVGHAAAAGDTYDFDQTPSTVTVASATSWELTNGATVVSDTILMPGGVFDQTKNLIVAFYCSVAGKLTVRRNSGLGANYARNYKTGASDVTTVDATGYTNEANYCEGINKVETLG